jgi:arylsulfatase A-like enzyme
MNSGSDQSDKPAHRLGPVDVLWFAAWCGLAGGELEVASRVVRRAFSPTDRMYLLTRHFFWLLPLINLALFLGFGMLCAVATRSWPRRAGWLCPRLIVVWAVLPALLIVGRGIYPAAWLVFAIGIAAALAPTIERHTAAIRPKRVWTFAALLAAVAIQGGWILGGDWLGRRREDAGPLPAADPPNVLLVVLDTVRADHLGLYGYERPTSPHLEDLARKSVRFTQARASAPWTLASHASLFTGRWAHELDIKWLHPMRGGFPTLAEYLGSLGYATAGFVGNTFYCAYDSGLDRGFTEYHDYVLTAIEAIRTVYLLDAALDAITPLEPALDRWLSIGLGSVMEERSVRQFTHTDRKNAGIVNRELLDWLDRRPQPRRPFFAFVNYVDAHAPYVLPADATYRFGPGPTTDDEYLFLLDVWLRVDKSKLPRPAQALGRDCYDSCVAYLDERVGDLLVQLRRCGVLDRTIVIVTADHGEGFGEHGLFDHGESVYSTEIRVPLLISLPPGGAAGKVVDEFVSLRDIPATIAELVSPGTKAPFPGRSLASLLRGPASGSAPPAPEATVLSDLSAPNPSDPNKGRSPATRGRLLSLAEGDFVYIRNEGDGKEELFNERDDPRQLSDRSRAASSSPVLQRFRDRLRQLIRAEGARS